MKFQLLSIITLLFFINTSLIAQNKDHKNYYKNVETIEKGDFSFSFKNMVAHQDYCKFGYSIENHGDNFLIIDWSKSAILINDGEYHDGKKEQIIKPGKSKSGTYNVAGEANYHVDAFAFKFDGVRIVPVEGKAIDAPNFKLPASTKEFTFGDFKVKMKKLKKETKETEVSFEVVYTGNNFAIINSGKIGVSIPDVGTDEFANDGKGKVILLQKGEKCQLKLVFHISAKYADMQFANLEILWRDAFQVSESEIIDASNVEFVLDAGLTEGKN